MLVKGHCQQTAAKINSSLRLKSYSKTEQEKQYVTLGNEECLVEQHHGTSPRLPACKKSTQQKYMQRYKAQDMYMLVINMENSVCQNYNPTYL